MKNNKLSYNTARIISIIFVPPTFNVLLFSYFAFYIESEITNQIFIISSSLIFGLFLPVLVFVMMRRDKKISDIDTSIKEERNAPYLLNSLFCLAAIPSYFFLEIDHFFQLLWGIFFINTLVLYFINKYWKISAHLIGATIPLGALLFIGSNLSIILLAIILIISWSRIKLRIHNFKQVFTGGLLGLSLTYFILYSFYNFVL